MQTSAEFIKAFSLSLCLASASLMPSITHAAETVKRPNILFCLADDVTWLHMGAYGCKWGKPPLSTA